jgi:nitroreductase/molybdopterin/thiamine biosynthesis adenylyltransferase
LTEYSPIIIPADGDALSVEKLTDLKNRENVTVLDTIEGQVKELVKCRNPKTNFKENPEKYQHFIEDYLAGREFNQIGNWVYYPWRNTLVHLLNQPEYFELRTNRNKYKITEEEQVKLAQKKVGVIGLSVGQAVAVTMAMECLFGELRLADFDEIEVSNLNRIRSGVFNIGVNKALNVAREISEIDPYLKLKVFEEGITHDNIDEFFTDGGNIDALVEECDGLDIKIVARQKAKDLGIPVIMETNDRAMLDIERFDQEPNRPILHGLVKDLDVEVLKTLKTNEDKVPYMLDMIGIEDTSILLRASMLEIEQSLSTWPQLASSVTFGGGIVCDAVRRILLGEDVQSGRFYHDIEQGIVKSERAPSEYVYDAVKPLTIGTMRDIASKFPSDKPGELTEDNIRHLVSLAHMAPSGGNMQPWKWFFSNGCLFLFLDQSLANSFLDYNHLGTMVGFGAAIENLKIGARSLGLDVNHQYVYEAESPLVAKITFGKSEQATDELEAAIEKRGTNRMNGELQPIADDDFNRIKQAAEDIPGAQLHWITDTKHELGDVLAAVERIRLLTDRGHKDFVEEIRWTVEEAENTKDGIDLRTIDLTETEKAGLWVSRDHLVVKKLRDLNLGTGFENLMKKSIRNTDRIGFITMPKARRQDYLEGGRALERAWLMATHLDLGFHPISPSTFIFSRFVNEQNDEQLAPFREELSDLRQKFTNLLGLNNGEGEIFIFRLFKGKDIETRSLRRDLSNHLFFDKS